MAMAPALEALCAGDRQAFGQMVDAAGVDETDEHGWTLLSWAAGRGDLEAVRRLVERGADVFHRGRDDRTPYLIALAAGHVDVAAFLRDAEEAGGGDTEQTSSRQAERRPYCRAYPVAALRAFAGWSEAPAAEDGGGDAEPLADGDVVFVHHDLSVGRSVIHGQEVVFSSEAPEWRAFCGERLEFRVPDDLELVPAR